MSDGTSVSVNMGKPGEIERQLDALAKKARAAKKEALAAERAQGKAGLDKFRAGKRISSEEAKLALKHGKKELAADEKKMLRLAVKGEMRSLGVMKLEKKVRNAERLAMAIQSGATGGVTGVAQAAGTGLGALTAKFAPGAAAAAGTAMTLGASALGIIGAGVGIGKGIGTVQKMFLEDRKRAARARGRMLNDTEYLGALARRDFTRAGELGKVQLAQVKKATFEVSTRRDYWDRFKDKFLPGGQLEEAAKAKERMTKVKEGLEMLTGRFATASEYRRAYNRNVVVQDYDRREAARDLGEGSFWLRMRARIDSGIFFRQAELKEQEIEAKKYYGEAAIEAAARARAEKRFLKDIQGFAKREEQAAAMATDLRQSYDWHRDLQANQFMEDQLRPKAAAWNRD